MPSKRSHYRWQRRQHEFQQSNYVNNLPNHESENDSTSRESFSLDVNFESLSNSDISTDELDLSPAIELNLVTPSKREYFEIVFETFISHIGLNLSESEKVVNLINSLNSRFSRDPIIFPSLRYYWDSKSKMTTVQVYILCDKKHYHGPYYGEPRHFQPYTCENVQFPAKIIPGKFFIHISLRKQLENILKNFSESFWREDAANFDISSAKQARKVKSTENGPETLRFTLTLHADEISPAKSSSEKLFPVFVSINELKYEFRRKFFLMVGLFVGKVKPPVECYLSPICDEFLSLEIDPIQICPFRKATFHLIGLVADAPMRAYLRNVKQYNHLNGCDWCLCQAETIRGARSYSNQTREDLERLKRTKEDFIQYKNLIARNELFQNQVSENPRFRGPFCLNKFV